MNPANYARERDAQRYAADLTAAWPKSLAMSFVAIPQAGGYAVQATDRTGRTYLVTARQERLCAVNFIKHEPA